LEYSLSKAAEVTGQGKSTIHRAIKSGKLSASRHEDGSYTIDASELSRVFPLEMLEPTERHGSEPILGTHRDSEEVLRVKVAMLEDQLSRERDTVEDLRKRLDKADDRLLSITQQHPSNAATKSFLARLLGL
jgi:hypothetical protein